VEGCRASSGVIPMEYTDGYGTSLLSYPHLPFPTMKQLHLLVLLIAVIGCSGAPRPAGLPKLYPVTLTIQQEGQPLSGTMVQLVPQNPSQWGSGGTTDAQGRVNIRTHGQYDGAPEGTYAVVLTKQETLYPMPEEIQRGSREDQMAWTQNNPNALAETFDLIQPEFQSPETTPLKVHVDKKAVKQTLDAGKAVRIPVHAANFR